jgi:protein-disulfide isomerase
MHPRRIPVLALTVLACALPALAAAQSPDALAAIRSELQALRESQEATRQAVEAIRALLEQAMAGRPAAGTTGAAPAGVASVKITGRPAKGSSKAAITLIEYSDYECPYCGQYAAETYPQVDRDYVRTNKVRYIFKSYPIAQLHKNAFRAHQAAACAGDQGQYWEMHDKLFADQRTLTLEGFVERGLALGLDVARLRTCIDGSSHDAMIQEDIDEATRGGVRGTPVFILAFTDPKAQAVTPARVLVGAQPYRAFKEAIDALLAQAATQPRDR